MKDASLFATRSRRLASSLLLASILASLLACGEPPVADNPAFHQAVDSGQSGVEVTISATVEGEPASTGDHEQLTVKADTGETVEVDHNVSLAQWVPAHGGSQVIIHGQLYIDPGPRVGIHCTHARTSSGCPSPGWIKLGSAYYQ